MKNRRFFLSTGRWVNIGYGSFHRWFFNFRIQGPGTVDAEITKTRLPNKTKNAFPVGSRKRNDRGSLSRRRIKFRNRQVFFVLSKRPPSHSVLDQDKNYPVFDVASAPSQAKENENPMKILVGNLASGAVAGCTVEAGKRPPSSLLMHH